MIGEGIFTYNHQLFILKPVSSPYAHSSASHSLSFPHLCVLLYVFQTLLYHTCPLQIHLTALVVSQLSAQLFLICSLVPQYIQRQHPTRTGLIVYVE